MKLKIKDKEFKVLIFVIASYVAIQIFSDFLGLKIINIPVINLSATAGIILYPLTFTIRDIAHKILGKTNVSYLVVSTVVLNILMIALLYVVINLPPSNHWELQESFRAVFFTRMYNYTRHFNGRIIYSIIKNIYFRLYI